MVQEKSDEENFGGENSPLSLRQMRQLKHREVKKGAQSYIVKGRSRFEPRYLGSTVHSLTKTIW
jgi:hypothetical protein